MAKDTARPAPEKKKDETAKKEGALKDSELEGAVGAGLDSYVQEQYRQHLQRTGGGGG